VEETATLTIGDRHAMESAPSRRLAFICVTVASLVYFAGLLHYAQVRPLDGDEGYYTSAARLVWEGKTPYKDFAFPQGILVPYLYSWTWAVHPRSLAAMRFLSAACGAIAALVWGVWLLSRRRLSTTVALATFAVVLFNPYWVWWNTALKTFAITNLLTSIAMICLYVALQSRRTEWYAGAGLALGICASARSLYAPLVPFVLVWLFYYEWRSPARRLRGTLAFLGGAAFGVLPMIISFVMGPQAFVFNNVRYRSLLSPHPSLRHTIHVYLNNLLSLFHHTYFVVTVLLAVAGAISLLYRRNRRDLPYDRQDYSYFQLAFLMLLVYVATASIPFPVFDQYFTSPLLPFLVVFIAEGLRVSMRFRTVTVLALAVILPILFFRGLKSEAAEYAPGAYQQLASFRAITEVVEANSRESDVVLSIWPGYVFASGRQYLPGSENQFNYDVANKISPEERKQFHVLSTSEVIDAISSNVVSIFITYGSKYYFEATMSPAQLQTFHAALDTNYNLVGARDGVEVYRRR